MQNAPGLSSALPARRQVVNALDLFLAVRLAAGDETA
jgi:hypothetical protein